MHPRERAAVKLVNILNHPANNVYHMEAVVKPMIERFEMLYGKCDLLHKFYEDWLRDRYARGLCTAWRQHPTYQPRTA